MPKTNGLTQKQSRFIEEYLVDFNGTQAAIRAGYSEKTAEVIAWENLRKDYIREAIDVRVQELRSVSEDGAKLLLERFVKQDAVRLIPTDRRQGVVYLLQADNGLVKVGITVNFLRRLAMLNTMLPYDLTALLVIDCDNCVSLERELHARYASKRVKGEWFRLTSEDVAWVKSKYGTVE